MSATIEVKEWLVIISNIAQHPNEPDFEILECSDEDLPEELNRRDRVFENITAVPLTALQDYLTQVGKKH